MSEDARKPVFSDSTSDKAAGPGATGIFGVVSPEPLSSTNADPIPVFSTSLPPIVVHEVTVQAAEVANPSENDALERLLRSEAAPRTPPPVVAPDATVAPRPVALPPAPVSLPPGPGEFTQLLSTLQIPAGPATGSAPPAQTSAGAGFPPMPTLPTAAEDDLSFTRLFEALGDAKPAPEPPRPQSPPLQTYNSPLPTQSSDAIPSTASPRAPVETIHPFAPSAGTVRPLPEVDLKAAGGFQAASTDDNASFTQLFAALGQEPRKEPSQAADYPPLRADGSSRPGALPSRGTEPSAASWSGFASQPPPQPHLDTREKEDLQSLTQLLRALEASPSAAAPPQAGYTPPAPLFPGRERAHSGATVAFTPPESVQRAEARGPLAPAGPGDFTRVLQTSALRESGIGSQAAAARSTPEPLAPSASPVHAAPAPLPPWASMPAPHVPQLPHLAHVNAGGGSVNMHANLPHYPHVAFTEPSRSVPLSAEARDASPRLQRGRMPVLLFVLLAIIVILVGVLVAVLLHR